MEITRSHLTLKAAALWTCGVCSHEQTGHKGTVEGNDRIQLYLCEWFVLPLGIFWFSLRFLLCEMGCYLPHRDTVRSKQDDDAVNIPAE